MEKSIDMESRLSAYLNTFVYEKLETFLYRRPPLKVLTAFSKRNAFYATILIHVFTGTEITLSSFDHYDEDQDIESLFQNGIYLYTKWTRVGIEKAALNYCQLMNRLLDRIPFSKEEANTSSLPDFCTEADKIVQYVKKLRYTCVPIKTRRSDGKRI